MATEELLKELLGSEKKKDFDIKQYLRLVWRKKHLIIVPLLLSRLIAIVGLNYIQNAMNEIKTATTDNKSISHDVVDGSGTLNEAIAELMEVVEKWQTPEFYSESESGLISGKNITNLLTKKG